MHSSKSLRTMIISKYFPVLSTPTECLQIWLCRLLQGCRVGAYWFCGCWVGQSCYGCSGWEKLPPTSQHSQIHKQDWFNEHGFGSGQLEDAGPCTSLLIITCWCVNGCQVLSQGCLQNLLLFFSPLGCIQSIWWEVCAHLQSARWLPRVPAGQIQCSDPQRGLFIIH